MFGHPARPAEPAVDPGLLQLLDRELTLLVERMRHLQVARWAAAAPPFATRADGAFHLAEVLAAASLALAGRPAYPLPRLAAVVLPDQIAVTGNEVLMALAAPPRGSSWAADPHTSSMLAASAVAEVVLHGLDLDGTTPSVGTAGRVLDALGRPSASQPRASRDLVLLARRRCPWPGAVSACITVPADGSDKSGSAP